MVIFGRTDLASEAHAQWLQNAGAAAACEGVLARQETVNGLSVTAVEITSRKGEAALKKPIGRYYTLMLPSRFERGSAAFSGACEALAALLRRCLPHSDEAPVLIAALGNPDITPDALGSLAAESILVTRHLKRSMAADFARFRSTALCRTGVLGTTGVESAEQILLLCRYLQPSCVIAVDALAGSDPDTLCRCLQLCDSGLAPGSGVNNSRLRLSREQLGVPVLAVGMPTVIDAACFSKEQALSSYFVTPRDIDSQVRTAARLIGFGIDLALHHGLSVEDLELLLN